MTKSRRKVKNQIEIRLAVEHSAVPRSGMGFDFPCYYRFRVKEKRYE